MADIVAAVLGLLLLLVDVVALLLLLLEAAMGNIPHL